MGNDAALPRCKTHVKKTQSLVFQKTQSPTEQQTKPWQPSKARLAPPPRTCPLTDTLLQTQPPHKGAPSAAHSCLGSSEQMRLSKLPLNPGNPDYLSVTPDMTGKGASGERPCVPGKSTPGGPGSPPRSSKRDCPVPRAPDAELQVPGGALRKAAHCSSGDRSFLPLRALKAWELPGRTASSPSQEVCKPSYRGCQEGILPQSLCTGAGCWMTAFPWPHACMKLTAGDSISPGFWPHEWARGHSGNR